MRKPTRTSLKKKLDKAVREMVRSRGKCERCGRKRGIQLQPAHIFSRKYMNTRHSLDNILCLCASCHFWAHSNPILFTEFVKKHLGEEKFNLLKESHNIIYKPTIPDLQTKLEVLEQMKEE